MLEKIVLKKLKSKVEIDRRTVVRLKTDEFTGANTLEFSLYYDKGGMNYFTSSVERRGYYLSVKPVSIGNGFVESTAFRGIKAFVGEEVSRVSKKARERALADINEELLSNLIAKVK